MKKLPTLIFTCSFFTFHFCLFTFALQAQSNLQQPTSVNSDGAAPAASAMLDVQATDKGMLVPRMTTAQRTAIASPAAGLLVYDTTSNSFWFYSGAAWANMAAGGGGTPTFIADADGNTKVQTEKNANEDIIRFDLGGTERMVLRQNANGAPRLELPNANSNTFIGTDARSSNTTGSSNTAIGMEALYSNSTGNNNTANGRYALFSNKANSRSTAIGYSAMYYADDRETGIDTYNTAVGYQALNGSTTAANNTGQFNTAIGDQALFLNSSGSANTALGVGALYPNTTGINNTAIGRNANFNSGILNNTTCIGYDAGKVSNTSNRIEIGNTSVAWIGGQVAWATYSDARIKERVQENVPGLDFITRLRPVTYHLNIHRQNELCNRDGREEGDWEEKYDIEQKQMTGFIAQEVEQAARAAGYDFSGVEQAKDEVGMYSVRYAEFVVPLVKGMQELVDRVGGQEVEI